MRIKRVANTVFPVLMLFMCAGSVAVAANEEGCKDTNRGIDTMQTENISLLNGRGKIVEVAAWIADDAFERSMGYQYICRDVIAKSAILFVYKKPVLARFHMNNVHGALDIGFFNGDGRLLHYARMQPYSGDHRPLYGPNEPFQFALEAPPGFFRQAHLMSSGVRLLKSSLHGSPE